MTHTPASSGEGERTYRVRIRAEHAAVLEAMAAREGASPEALASLWIEEKADEARRLLGGAGGRSARGAETNDNSDR